MQTVFISSGKYDIALDRLLSRRLEQSGCVYALSSMDGDVSVTVPNQASLAALAEALLALMCRDLIYFELARQTDALPLTLREKQGVLRDALMEARALKPPHNAHGALMTFLKESEFINLEGYLRFRLRDMTALWGTCLEHAAAEQMLRRDYAALLGVIVQSRPARMHTLSVCLNADGSCTLSDESNALIEYVDGSEDGLLSLLVEMAPARLTLYDLSEGRSKGLADAIQAAFAGRVHIYR